jgi:hypothetical protein
MQEQDIRATREAYQLVFNSEEGQRVLEDLQKRFHIHGTVFSTEPTDPAYRVAHRTVVLFIQST